MDKKKLENLKIEIREKMKDKKKRNVSKVTLPQRFDKVYIEGTKWLNSL